MNQGSFVSFTREEEPLNPDSPKTFIREIKEDNTRILEATGTSSPDREKRTAEEAGLNDVSNIMEVDSPKKSRYINCNEETIFATLIHDALIILQKYRNIEDDDISNGIKVIINSFHYDKGNQFSDVDFEIPENICAFVYRYGPCAAGLTRCRTLEALNNCPTLLLRLKVSSSINIISLGSGPGCDIIGLCSALYEHTRYRRVKLTLVDSVKGWLPAFNLTEFSARAKEYGNVSRFFQDSDVSTTFLRADVADETENEVYLSALQEADVILINKLFSILTADQKEIIEKTVIETMKEGAILLFIDSPNYSFRNLELIYSYRTLEEYNFQGKFKLRYFNYISTSSKAQISVYMKKSSEYYDNFCIY